MAVGCCLQQTRSIMHRVAACIVALGLVGNCAFPDHRTIVDLGYVRYRGVEDDVFGVTSWNGIRYALPPAGQLRWREPVAVDAHRSHRGNTEIQDASIVGANCMPGTPAWSYKSIPEGEISQILSPASEDCLSLNVHVPTRRAEKLLPVLFIIHGGGFTLGNSLSTPGTQLVSRSNSSIIAVEIQYRLGGLGFLAGKAVSADGVPNVGLLDQRAALEWVQRHIQSFGGDPQKVTIVGGSAGGGSVTAQLQLYGGTSNPPFRAAIPDYPWWQTLHNETFYDAQYSKLLQMTNCHSLSCLRGLNFNTLYTAIEQSYITAYKDGLYGYGDYYYGPAIDGAILRESPSTAFASGNFARVPMIIDRNAFEGLPFSNLSISTPAQAESDLQQLWPSANASFFDDMEHVYPLSAFDGTYFSSAPVSEIDPSKTAIGSALAGIYPRMANAYGRNPAFWRRQQVFGDAVVGCSTRVLAAACVTSNVKCWKYIFNHGAYVHGASEFALFTEVFAPFTNGREQLADYVLTFVEHLDPNTPRSASVARSASSVAPFWPQYGKQSTVLQFNATGIGVGHDPDDSERCEFLRRYSDVIRN